MRERESLVGEERVRVTQAVAYIWSYGKRYSEKGAKAAAQIGVRIEVERI